MRSPRSLASCRYHWAQFDRRALPLLRRFSTQRSAAARPPLPLASPRSHRAPAPPPPLASYPACGTLTASCGFVCQEAVYFLPKSLLLQILSGLRHILRPPEIAPIILIGPKGGDFFSSASNTQIGVDDGENAFFTHHGKQTRRNNVDAGERQRLHLA